MMISLGWAAAVLTGTIQLAAPAPTSAQDMIQRIESAVVLSYQIGSSPVTSLADRLKALRVPGLSVAVVKDLDVHWAKGFGVRDAETGEPVTEETLFQAASITKSISAALTLRLFEKGLLDLDRDVNDYLKRWKVPENEFTATEKVTIRRILSHTAGLTVSGMPSYGEGESLPSLLQILDGQPPARNVPVRVDRTPGTEYKYSGGGYTVLQVLIEDVTGRPLPQLAVEEVFRPAGMARSVICLCNAPALAGQAASAHSAEGGSSPGQAFVQGGSGCCELWTTATDLARYVIALQKSLRGDPGALLSRPTARMMATLEREGGRGLGLTLRRYGGVTYIGHDGSNVGFIGRILGHPDKGYGLAVLANANAWDILDDMMTTIAAAYGWEGIKPDRYASAAEVGAESRRKWTSSPPPGGSSEAALGPQGFFLLRRGYDGAGIAVLRLMVELNPRSASAADTLGSAYARIGDKANALKTYRRAKELLDRYPEANRGNEARRASILAAIQKLEGGGQTPGR